MTRIVNEKRVCGRTVEGFGPDSPFWNDHEYKCVCGRWTKTLSDYSTQVGDDADDQAMLCEACGEKVRQEWAVTEAAK